MRAVVGSHAAKILGLVTLLIALILSFTSLSIPTLQDDSFLTSALSMRDRKLAIVMPFTTGDMDRVIKSLASWGAAPPCSEDYRWAKLVFYFYSNKELSSEARERIEEAVGELDVPLNCFKSFNFVSASIAAELDHYNPDARDSSWVAGPNEQFYQLINNTGVIPSSVSHVFMMEPDTRPIRPFWVSHLQSILAKSDPFWIRGSAFRGACTGRKTRWSTARPDCHQLGDLSEHINGNAFYSVGDPGFRSFLTEVRTSTFSQWPFDLAWYKYLGQKGMEKQKASLSSNFVFTELVRNYGSSDFDLDDVTEQSPWTYFVHSDEPSQSSAQKRFEQPPETDRAAAREALPAGLVALLDRKAAPNGDIMVSFTTGNYGDMASNFVHFVAKAGIKNFIMIAMDEDAEDWANASGVDNYAYLGAASAEIGGSDSYWSEGFRNIVTRRARLMSGILKAGFNVLESDVDIIWLRNPFHILFDGPYEFEVQSDARLGYIEDDDQARFPQFVNSGCFYARSTARMADFFALWADAMEEHEDWLDQQALNNILAENVLRIKFRIMDPVLVPNGFVYFSRTLPQRANVEPVAIHNNWIDGGAIKQHRFREAGLWVVDPPEYFDTKERKYLAMSPPPVHGNSVNHNSWTRIRNSLRSAIAISEILNRTLILPKGYAYYGHPHPVTLNYFLDFKSLMTEVPNFRESNFLQKMWPEGPSKLFNIDNGVPALETPDPKIPIIKFTPSNGFLGATDEEIVEWFAPYANETLIQFTDLFARFHWGTKHPKANAKMTDAVKPSSNIHQIAGHIAAKLVGTGTLIGKNKYDCVHLPRGKFATINHEDSIVETLKLMRQTLDPSEVLYVITDEAENSEFRATIREVYPHAFFRTDFTAVTKKFTETDASLGTTMLVGAAEQMMCAWSNKFVGNIKSLYTNEICKMRQAGRSGDAICKDIHDRTWRGGYW